MRPLRTIRLLTALHIIALAVSASAADVKSLGARGDGQADDTAAIQKAVDAGGSVTFPTGTYKLTRTITIDLDKTGFVVLSGDATARVVMAGAGPAFQFTGTHLTGSAAPSQFKPNVWDRQRSPTVTGLEIVGAHPEADGIAARGTMQLTIRAIIVREARHAIRLHDRNRNVLISDVHLYHNRGIGVFYDNVNLHQSNITGSHISYNAGGGIVARGGDVRNIHIGNCDIESNMAKTSPAGTANILIDCTGGSIGEVAITGCTIQHNAEGPESANIRILGAGILNFRNNAATREGNVTITGNVLSDVQTNIHLKQVRDVTITGNTFWMAYQHDLLVEDSSEVVVGSNNFDRNPRYNYGRTDFRGGIVFRDSRDCTLTGLHVNGIHHHEAAVVLENCTRFNATNSTVLDSDGIGLLVKNSSHTRIAGWLIRDDRAANTSPSLQVTGGRANTVVENTLDRPARIAGEAATARNNDVVAK